MYHFVDAVVVVVGAMFVLRRRIFAGNICLTVVSDEE